MACRLYSKLSSIPVITAKLFDATTHSVRNAATMSAFDLQHKTPVQRKTIAVPKAQYGGRHTVTMLPGGGIGPELMNYVKEVFRSGGVPVDFEVVQIDPKSDSNEDLEYAITSIKRNGVAIKGNIETGSLDTGVISRNVALRNELDLYVNVLSCKSYEGIVARHQNIDICIVRQNTEGEYAMLEHESAHGVVETMKIVTQENSERVARFAFEFAKKNNRKKITVVHKANIMLMLSFCGFQSVSGVVESMKIVTKENSQRVARFAFEFARKNGRKKMTIVHKANIMKLSDGLFLEIARNVGKDYPDIETGDMIIDNCCMQLVSNPHQFDVMLMTNLYGTIVSNVICGLVGGAGLLSGRNYGDHYAIFEPGTRNTGTAIAGKNIANPIAMLNAAVDMLEHLGHQTHATLLSNAINQTVNIDKIHTPDLGGTATSTDVVQNIIKHILEATKSMKWNRH